MENQNKSSRNKSLFWGGLLVLAGVFFLLRNMDVIHFEIPWYLINWRIIFVIFTINALLSRKYQSAVLWGGLCLILYAPLVLNIQPFQFKFLWPLAVIAIGIFIIGKVRTK